MNNPEFVNPRAKAIHFEAGNVKMVATIQAVGIFQRPGQATWPVDVQFWK